MAWKVCGPAASANNTCDVSGLASGGNWDTARFTMPVPMP